MDGTLECCISCGAVVPRMDGPVHDYLLSSPGCWSVYCSLLEREYSDPSFGSNHQITVDAYAVQHYGRCSPQTIRSLNLHLASLYLVYERGLEPKQNSKWLDKLAKYDHLFMWLDAPPSVGEITVADVLGSLDAQEHCRRVYEWGGSAWRAWHAHHETIAELVHGCLRVPRR